MRLRMILALVIVISALIIPVFSHPTVRITPDRLYSDKMVQIEYANITDGSYIDLSITTNPDVKETEMVYVLSYLLNPFNLTGGTFTGYDGNRSNFNYLNVLQMDLPSKVYPMLFDKNLTTQSGNKSLGFIFAGEKIESGDNGTLYYRPYIIYPFNGTLSVEMNVDFIKFNKSIPYSFKSRTPQVIVEDTHVPDVGSGANGSVIIKRPTFGLSSYNLTVRLDPVGKGTISSAVTPSHAVGQIQVGDNNTTVTINATSNLAPGQSNYSLLDLTYAGLSNGTANITVTVNSMIDTGGLPVDPYTLPGLLSIGTFTPPVSEFSGAPRYGNCPSSGKTSLISQPVRLIHMNGISGIMEHLTNATPGIYSGMLVSLTISLNATNEYGSDTETKSDYIQAREVPGLVFC